MAAKSSAAVASICIVALLLGALGALADSQVFFYNGDPNAVALSTWGSGKIASATDQKLEGKPSLRIDTGGFAEGGRIDLKTPVDLKPFLDKPDNAFLVALVKVPKAGSSRTGGAGGPGKPGGPGMMPGMGMPGMPGMGGTGMGMGGPGMPGMGGPGMPGMGGTGMPGMGGPGMPGMGGTGMPGMGGPGMPGMGGPGMPGMGGPGMGMGGPGMPGMGGMGGPGMPGMGGPGMGMGGPGMPGMGMGMQSAAARQQPIDKLRFLLVTDKGQAGAGTVPIDPLLIEFGDWVRIVIPVSQFKGPGLDAAAQLQKLAIFGNVSGRFYVGRAWLEQDDAPIIAHIEGDHVRVVKSGEKLTLKAAPQPAGSKARLIWNMDDVEPNREDAYGYDASFTYDADVDNANHEKTSYFVTRLIAKDPDGKRVTQIDKIYVRVDPKAETE